MYSFRPPISEQDRTGAPPVLSDPSYSYVTEFYFHFFTGRDTFKPKNKV